jgi:hypothetical protein
VGFLERLSQGLSEFVNDKLMSRLSMALLATILSEILNFFHLNWKDFDKN